MPKGRPKKNTNNPEIQKGVKKSAFTIKKVPNNIHAEANIYRGPVTYNGETFQPSSEKDSIDNLIVATKELREQKSPVFEIKKQFDGDPIFEKYQEKCLEISDINELLPKIYEIACDCETIVEFGVRRPTSTYALLAAKPKMLTSYDLGRYEEEVGEVERLCQEEGQAFKFIQANILEIEIEQVDCILSDAFHSKKFVEEELRLHANKAKKYIIFHDWFSYGEHGEQPYNDETSPYGAGQGIKYAIYPFLETHPEWQIEYQTDINNGLLILKRI